MLRRKAKPKKDGAAAEGGGEEEHAEAGPSPAAQAAPSKEASMKHGKKMEENYVWQDREIRFDMPNAELECRSGEYTIDSLVR